MGKEIEKFFFRNPFIPLSKLQFSNSLNLVDNSIRFGNFCKVFCDSNSLLLKFQYISFYRFLRFNQARIPRINLLNRNSDVTPDGRYISALKDEKKRFSATLGTLSGGRVSITGIGVSNLKLAITIAIR